MSPFFVILMIAAAATESSAILGEDEVLALWRILHKQFPTIEKMILPVTEDNVQYYAEGEAGLVVEKNDRDEMIIITDEVSIVKPKSRPFASLKLPVLFSECVKVIANKWFADATHVGFARVLFDPVSHMRLQENAELKKDTIVQFLIVVLRGLRKKVLSTHNRKRKLHGAPDLELDDELNSKAQEYAVVLASGDGIDLVHSSYANNCIHGENLANYGILTEHKMNYSAADFACSDWYGNNKYYDYKAPDFKTMLKWGTFTAMVWKASRRMGLGVAYNTIRTNTGLKVHVIWVVARYLERGNVEGKYLENVSRPKE